MTRIFKEKVLPLKNKLFRYAFSILENKDIAGDVVQETFIKVWEKRHEIAEYKSIEAWCMTLTRNFALSKFRLKESRNVSLDVARETHDKNELPDQILEKEELIRCIDGIVAQLPYKQKEVFQLRDIEGYSYDMISQITGYELSDVKISLFRARKTIKEKLLKIQSYGKHQTIGG